MSSNDLEARIGRLEWRSRLWSGIAFAALAWALTTSALAPEDEVVAAERFELVDAEGRVRAEVAIDEDGSAGFFVRDEDGRVRATLIQDDSQAAMYLLDGEGTIRVGAAQYAHGGGGFALHGEESKGGAVLYMKEREGSLTFYDAEGDVRSRLPE